jgi:hypothetical protein
MSDTIETRSANCPSHGVVTAERRLPRPGFPFIVYAIRRALATRRPYRCPECGQPLATG